GFRGGGRDRGRGVPAVRAGARGRLLPGVPDAAGAPTPVRAAAERAHAAGGAAGDLSLLAAGAAARLRAERLVRRHEAVPLPALLDDLLRPVPDACPADRAGELARVPPEPRLGGALLPPAGPGGAGGRGRRAGRPARGAGVHAAPLPLLRRDGLPRRLAAREG